MTEATPQGVVAVFVTDNRVVAQASDFNRSRPGGFTLREAQEHRARASLAWAVVRECCSTLIASNLDSYICEQILQKLPGKVHVIPVGYGDDNER